MPEQLREFISRSIKDLNEISEMNSMNKSTLQGALNNLKSAFDYAKELPLPGNFSSIAEGIWEIKTNHIDLITSKSTNFNLNEAKDYIILVFGQIESLIPND